MKTTLAIKSIRTSASIANVTNLNGTVDWPVPTPAAAHRFFRAQVLIP